MNPASTSMRPSPSRRRTRAGSRMSWSRTRAPSSIRSGCDLALAGIVLRRQHGGLELFAQLALGLGTCAALWSAFLRSALRDFADASPAPAPRIWPASGRCGAPVPSAWPIRASPIHARALFRAPPSATFLAELLFKRVGLFDTAVQLAQESRHVALRSASSAARAIHDVLGNAEPRRQCPARPTCPAAPVAELYVGSNVCSSKPIDPFTTPRVDAP